MATALTLNQYSDPEKPLIHNARSYDIMQRRIIQQLFGASSKKTPANLALELVHHHIDLRNALIDGRPDRYVPPTDFEDYFVFRLWKILFKMASKLYTDWERERLVSFASHLGKYFYPVRGRTQQKMDHIWGPLFIMRPRLLDALDEERFLITDDPVLNIPWDRIKFDWGFFPSTEHSAIHAFKGKYLM